MTIAPESPTTVAVDPRIAARRREVASDLRRRRRRRTFVVGGLALALAAAYGLSRTPLLDVDDVTVAGVSRTSPDDVRAAAGIDPGDQLIDIGVDRAAEAVESLPWVAEARVSRGITGSVAVEVVERTPVAVAVDEVGTPMLVDADGRVLAPVDDPAAVVGTIVVQGVVAPPPGGHLDPVAAPALDLLARLSPGLQARITGVVVAPDGQLSLTLRPQGTVVLGPPTELDTKLASLVTTLSQVDQDRLVAINLTVPDVPAVTRQP